MNGRCETCDVEESCAYEYKPCDCCDYRKFKPKPIHSEGIPLHPSKAIVIPFPAKEPR